MGIANDKWVKVAISVSVPESKVSQEKDLLIRLTKTGHKSQPFNGIQLDEINPLGFEFEIHTEKVDSDRFTATSINGDKSVPLNGYYFVDLVPKGEFLSPMTVTSNIPILWRIAIMILYAGNPQPKDKMADLPLNYEIKFIDKSLDGRKLLVVHKNALSISGELKLAIELGKINPTLCKGTFILSPSDIYSNEKRIMDDENNSLQERERARKFIEFMRSEGFIPKPKVTLIAKYQDGKILLVHYKGETVFSLPTEDIIDGETEKEALKRLIIKLEKLGFKIFEVSDLRKDYLRNIYLAEAKVISDKQSSDKLIEKPEGVLGRLKKFAKKK